MIYLSRMLYQLKNLAHIVETEGSSIVLALRQNKTA